MNARKLNKTQNRGYDAVNAEGGFKLWKANFTTTTFPL